MVKNQLLSLETLQESTAWTPCTKYWAFMFQLTATVYLRVTS